MTDKELIKQEIEETLNGLFDYIPSASKVLYNDFTKDEAVVLGKYKALEDILKFIDSLPEEPASGDLIEEIDKIWKTCNPIDEGMGVETANIHIEQFDDIARHFAEWQKQQMKETLQTEYEKGRFDMREEMMKNTVLETEVLMDCDGDGIETPYEEWLTLEDTEIPCVPDGFKNGDIVKVVLIKEDLP